MSDIDLKAALDTQNRLSLERLEALERTTKKLRDAERQVVVGRAAQQRLADILDEQAVLVARVASLEAALRVAGMNNHLARCGGSAMDWERCEHVSCVDSRSALGGGR